MFQITGGLVYSSTYLLSEHCSEPAEELTTAAWKWHGGGLCIVISRLREKIDLTHL
jgi:hypothetical protein